MKSELIEITKEYSVFETAVRQQITEFCASHCSNCEQVCCRPEYCRENIDSPFLNLLSSKIRPKAAYDDEHGWLSSTGCALSTGRPPVCYQFNCKKIIDGLPDDLQCYFFQVLSNLVPHIGKQALGTLHLVEIMDADQLKRVKIARFGKRLAEARQALQILQSVKGNGFPAPQILADLSKIVPIPRSLAG